MFNLLRLSSVLFLLSLFYSCGDLKKLQTKSVERTRGSLDTFKVIYDFNTKLYERKLVYPKIDHPTVFIIKNINRLAYEVSIESKDSSLMEASSDDFVRKILILDTTKGLKTEQVENTETLVKTADLQSPTGVAPNKQLKNGLSKNDSTAKKEVEKQISISQRVAQLDVELADQIKVQSILERDIAFANLECEKLKKLTGIESSPSIKDSLEHRLKQDSIQLVFMAKGKAVVDSLIKQLKDNKRILEEELSSATKNAFIKRGQLQREQIQIVNISHGLELIKVIHRNLFFLIKDPHIDYDKAQKKLKNIIGRYPDNYFQSFRDTLNILNSSILSFYTSYEIFKNDDEVRTAYQGYDVEVNVKPYKLVVEKTEKLLQLANYGKLLEDIYEMTTSLNDTNNFQIVSAPIQPKRDMILFDVKIKSKDSSGKYINDNRSFRYHDYVRGGIRYDFSTGIALNLRLNNESYRLVTIPGATDSVEIVKNKDRNAPTPQIAALFHTSIRTKTLFRTGFTLGTTLNTADFNITTVFIGFSAMFGRSEKYILTAGTALKRTNVLAGKYDVGQRFNSGAISEAILTEQTWKAGPFISFSYNLTQKQKQ